MLSPETTGRRFGANVLGRTVAISESNTPARLPVFVVEGISDWADRVYFPALVSLLRSGIVRHLYVIDDSRTYQTDVELRRRVAYRKAKLILSLTGEPIPPPDLSVLDRLTFFDKANSDDRAEYEKLLADAVFIVTPPGSHAEIASRWTTPVQRASQIFIEKPLAEASTDTALTGLGQYPIYGIDHYLLRASWLASLGDSQDLMEALGDLQVIKLRMIERSVSDLVYRPGAEKGMILDMLPHLLALVYPFADLDTIKLTALEVARCSRAPSSHRYETFAKVRFTCSFVRGRVSMELPGEAIVGKGVVPDVGDKNPGKYFELCGTNGSLVVKLEGDYAVRRINRDGTSVWYGDLTANPYEPLLREVALGSTVPTALLTFTSAMEVLKLLEKARGLVKAGAIAEYSEGSTVSDTLEIADEYSLTEGNQSESEFLL